MTKHNKYNLAAFFLLFALQCFPCLAEEYHIDSQKQFDALSTTVFLPGDSILFKRGVQFNGMFAPSGKGTEQAPIRIDVYGQGERPRINSHGKHLAGLFLQDPSYWEVNGLEITNTDGTDNDQGQLFGIYVLAKGAEGTYKHIYINDCYLHDINGKVAGKNRGGIHVHVKGLESTVIHDLRITNNRIVRVGGVGIGNASSCGRVEFRKHDTVIRYNVSQNDKEGIFENNIFFFKGRGNWGKNADGTNTSFRNNLYFNIPPHKSDTNHIAANPMLVQPGIAGTDINLKTMDALRGYRLRPVSPCIDTGVTINNHGGKDLLGTKVMIRKTDVGAFERD